MISTQQLIYCPNPTCAKPVNSVGNSICASCQTPIIYRYLWAISPSAAKIPKGEKVGDRYEVITPQIWLDTQPGKLPDIPEEIPNEVIPYLRLYQQRLHLPQVYGFVRSPAEDAVDILLLENVPVDENGNLYGAIAHAWQQATAVRQVYWLWQILQLWTPLSELGVAASLLKPDNLRVQGWCVRLLELVETLPAPSLKQLGECWQPWVTTAKAQIVNALEKIVQQMCSGEANLEVISAELNALLLSSAAELPLTLKLAGATDTGPEELIQNEDNCYPDGTESIDDPLLPQVMIVCDGIGGHEGGEVASQLAVQSVKLQIHALLQDVAEQAEIVPPQLLQQQIEASLRVANNVICNCNNEQKRAGIQRMATTLVMAVQLPQNVRTTSGWHSKNAHELYLANVGDSRAYWITRNYCQLLTVDDDLAAREVLNARSFYRKVLQRPDATALIQALGIKDGEFLRPLIERFIVEEDGVLLLCSDGLSDNQLVEQHWHDYAAPVLTGELSPEEAVYSWIKLANQKNHHDNISVVLTHYRVSPDYLVPVTSQRSQIEIVEEKEVEIVTDILLEETEESELAESSQILLDLDISPEFITTVPTKTVSKKNQRQRQPWLLLTGLLVMLLGGTTAGLLAWWQFNPQTFQQMCRQLPQRVQQLCPPQK